MELECSEWEGLVGGRLLREDWSGDVRGCCCVFFRGSVMERADVAFECCKLLAPEREEATSALVGAVEGGTGCSKGLRGDTGFEPVDAESILAVAGAASIPLPVLSVDDMDKSGATGGVTSLPDPMEPLMLVLLLQVVLESEGGRDKSRGAF